MALRRPRDSSFPARSRGTGSCKPCLQTASGTCRVRRPAWPALRERSGYIITRGFINTINYTITILCRTATILSFGLISVVELAYRYIFFFKFILSCQQFDNCSQCLPPVLFTPVAKLVEKFADSVIDIGGKFAASVVDTGGNFAASDVDTGGAP